MSPLRLFVALDLPPAIKSVVAQAQARLQASWQGGSMRWADPHGSHITIKYLGDSDQLVRIQAELASVGPQVKPFTLHTTQPGAFPNATRPRILWLGVSGDLPALARLQQHVEAALAPLGFPREQRAFAPHITLGRVKYSNLPQPVAFNVAPTSDPSSSSWNATELVLMRSETGPQGAHYTPVHSVRLDAR